MATSTARRSLGAQRIGCIGGGNMAEAIVAGLVSSNSVPPSNLVVSDVTDARAEIFTRLGVRFTHDNQDVVDSSELVIVCVKPQVVGSVLPRLRVDASKVVVSIVAGTGMATFEAALGAHVRLVRVMPNTPMLSLQGACGLVGNAAAVQHGDVELVAQVFTVCAPVVEFLQHEDQINAVTAVSGSGPAYIFRMMEAMIEGGVREGLSRETSQRLAIQTVIGAGVLAREQLAEGVLPDELRRRVTSPKGTTEAALNVLESNKWFDVTVDAVRAAGERGRQLAKL